MSDSLGNCVHCLKPLTVPAESWLYDLSRYAAHVRCVAQPSIVDTDRLLVRRYSIDRAPRGVLRFPE